MKTSELIGPALDWAVAKCEVTARGVRPGYLGTETFILNHAGGDFCYSIDWSQGGPILERERIRIDCPWNPGPFEATCKIDGVTGWCKGPTILIAAMRAYVASHLGDEVEIPSELQP